MTNNRSVDPVSGLSGMPFRRFARFTISVLFATALTCLLGSNANAQEEANNLITNGSFEDSENDYPTGWIYPARLNDQGYKLSIETDDPFEGKQAALLDSTENTLPNGFGLLNFQIDPEPLRGKRVRFRAAVRTAERSAQGRAQLWLRVDRESGGIGAFDNMGGRPITNDEWKHYDIIVDVDDDAKALTIGMLVLGKCKAWIDDASFEVVDKTVEKTKVSMGGGGTAAKAPTQPFYNHWLWLAVLVLGLFVLSQCKNSLGQRFALRFAIVYWILYSFPSPFSNLVTGTVRELTRICSWFSYQPEWLSGLSAKYFEFYNSYQESVEKMATWVANNCLGIEGELVSSLRNGSGDTTIAYVKLFMFFIAALAAAIVWSGVMVRRDKDHTWLRDLLRTYLRYVLALTMLSYGLAKAGFIMTQFARDGGPSEFQLDRTYGDSSPMGLLWTFMAASPMYTFFAGMGEVVGGVLLVFRRTATLGALVTFGVMLNVVMLNFCYDVPVKQYSFHLLIMAIMVAGPDIPRLFNVLVLNRPTESTGLLTPAYIPEDSPKRLWTYRVAKGLLVLALVISPVYSQFHREITHEHQVKAESEHLLMNRGYRWINEYPFNR